MAPSSSRGSGTRPGTSSPGSTRGPRASRGTPAHRWAAAGPKTSRPAKVGPGAAQLVLGIGQLDSGGGAADHADGRSQQPVVGPHEVRLPVADLDGDGPPVGAHAGVDHCQHDAGAEVLDAAGQRQGAGLDVVGLDVVGDVDDRDLRRDRADDRLDHADELVAGAVVGQEARSCRSAGPRASVCQCRSQTDAIRGGGRGRAAVCLSVADRRHQGRRSGSGRSVSPPG